MFEIILQIRTVFLCIHSEEAQFHSEYLAKGAKCNCAYAQQNPSENLSYSRCFQKLTDSFHWFSKTHRSIPPTIYGECKQIHFVYWEKAPVQLFKVKLLSSTAFKGTLVWNLEFGHWTQNQPRTNFEKKKPVSGTLRIGGMSLKSNILTKLTFYAQNKSRGSGDQVGSFLKKKKTRGSKSDPGSWKDLSWEILEFVNGENRNPCFYDYILPLLKDELHYLYVHTSCRRNFRNLEIKRRHPKPGFGRWPKKRKWSLQSKRIFKILIWLIFSWNDMLPFVLKYLIFFGTRSRSFEVSWKKKN
jgi:hypothetical protein